MALHPTTRDTGNSVLSHSFLPSIIFVLLTLSGTSFGQTWSSQGYSSTGTYTVSTALTVDQNVSITSGVFYISSNVTDDAGGTAYSITVSNNNYSSTASILQINSGTTTFEGVLTVSSANLIVKSGATLVVGGLNISSGSKITVEAGATLIINGNMTDTNNGQGSTVIDGYVQINGNYTASSGSVEITGSGLIEATGTMTTNGGSTIYGNGTDCTSGPCSSASLGCSFTNTISPSSQSLCQGDVASAMSAVTNASSATYQWQLSTTSASSGFSNISGATQATYSPSSVSVNSWFKVRVTSNGCTSSSASAAVNVSAQSRPTITLSGSATSVCQSSSAQTTYLSYSATTNSPTTYSISWSSSPSNSFASVVNATLGTSPIAISVPANTTAGTYTGYLTVSNGCTSTSSSFTVTVRGVPTITLSSAATTVCASSSSQTTSLTYSATSNSPITYSISWDSTPSNTFVPVTNATLTTSPLTINIPAGTAGGTYTGRLTVANANCTSSSNAFTVTVNGLPTIAIASSSSNLCFSNSQNQTSTLAYTSTTNSPTTYSISWSPTNANLSSVSNATLGTSPISITVGKNTPANTYTGTLTVRNANGCVSASNTFTMVVSSGAPTVTPSNAASVCTSTSSQTTTLPYTATNGPQTYSITWNSAALAAGLTNVTSATITASPLSLTIPANVAAGTYSGTLKVSSACGTSNSASTNFSVTVNALPTITLGTAPAVCFSNSAQTTTLSYSATSGSPTTYSIAWDTNAQNAGFTAISNSSLSSSPITLNIPANAPANTYTGTLTVRNGNSCVSTSNSFSVTVNALPGITLGSASAVCFSTSAQTTTLSYSATSGSPTTYSITWDTNAQNAGFAAVSNAALPSSPITLNIPASAASNAYTGTFTVRNGNSCVSTSNSFSVTVNALPTITLGTASNVCFSSSAQTTTLNYTATSGSPTSYNITWDANALNAGFAAVSNSALPSSPITVNIPSNAAANTYTGTLSVKNGNSCISNGQSFGVTIIGTPSAANAGADQTVCNNISVNLAANVPATGTGTWSIASGPDTNSSQFSNTASTTSSFNPSTTGIYTLAWTIANAPCANTTDNVVLTFNALPVLTAPATASLCSGSNTNISLSADLPCTYSYSLGAVSAEITGALAGSGSSIQQTLSNSGNNQGSVEYISVALSSAGCSSVSQSTVVTVNPTPALTNNGTPAAICSGTQFGYTLTTPTTNASIQWARQANANIAEIPASALGSIDETLTNVSTTDSTTVDYIVSVDANGCASQFGLSVNVGPHGALIWTGNVSSDWNDGSNWTCSFIPTGEYHVTIPGGTTYRPVISGTAFANNITIAASASLQISDSATFNIAGDLTNNGTFIANRSTVKFNGSTNQIINAKGAEFYEIDVNKSSGSLTIAAGYSLPLKHLLLITSNTTLNTNGNLILISTDSTTTNDAGIGPIPAGASINGDVTVQRMIKSEGIINRYISAPVSNVNLAQLTDDFTVKSGSIRFYNESTAGVRSNGYTNWTTTSTFQVGRGYLAYMYSNVDVLWDVKGPINRGDIPLKVTYTATTGGVNEDGWNLVGNPYPSAVRWYKDGWQRTNVESTISVPDLSIQSGYPNYFHYFSYNDVDGTGDLPGGIIAMGQAFWVHANAAAPNLTITEAAKTSASGGRFYRQATSRSEFLKITINKGEWADNAFFKINKEATEDYDKFDGFKLKNPYMNVFLMDKSARELSMNALPRLPEKEVPIGIEVAEAGTFTLTISNTENFKDADDFYLVDKYEGAAIKVNNVISYPFKTLTAGTIADRFYLTSKPAMTQEMQLQVYPNPTRGTLRIRADGGIKEIKTLDTNGTVIMASFVNGEVTAEFDMSSLASGVYILSVRTTNGISYQRVIKE